MLWLQTFGGPIVFDGEGQPKLAAAQRRSLGLLSVLAVAGSGGLSRDKIVGLLWPDVSAKRARHSLTQALYAARKSLDCDCLVEGIEDLRLDPQGIQTDLAAFEAAMQHGDDEAAARLYRGPFLDGFFPPTPVFERWLDAQRAGFEERAVGVLKRLAERAVLAADHAKAVEWLRELTAIRPGNSAITVQLMQALAASGDTHAALQRAQLYTKIRRDDFELDADPAVVEFAEGLRKSAPKVLIPDPPEPASEVFHLSAAASTTGEAPVADPDPQAGAIVLKTELTGYRRRAQSRRRGFAVSATLLAAMAYLFFNRQPAPTLPVFSSSILVAPFRVISEDPALAYLREGMVELLSTHLADDSAAPAVDAGAVLQAWRRAGLSGRSPEPGRDTVVSVAARLGAERVIVGSIVGTQKRAVVRATIVQAASGKVDGEGQVEGPIDSLTNMVDRLAAQLLAVQAGLSTSLADRTTKAVPALRAYLFGAAAYSIGDFAIAANRFERALQVDSTFAIAALRLGLTARQLNQDRLERHALALAWRHRNALTQRDSAHLIAVIGPRYPELSSEAESLIAWENAVRALPARPEVLYGYAAFLAERSGYQLAEPQRERALAALDRALALDSVFVLAHQLRLELADSAVDLPPVTPFLRWRLAVTRADTATLTRFADSLSAMGPANLRALIAASQFDGIQLETGTRAVTVLRNRTPAADDAMDHLLAAYSFATLARDTAASSDIIRAMQRASPVTHVHLRLRVLDALYGEADSVGAAQAALELERAIAAGESNDPAADACVVGQWQIARNDTSGYRVVLNTLQSAPPTSGLHIATAAAVCAPLLSAQYAVNTAQPNARDLVQSLDTLVMTSPAAGDAAVYAHIALARLHRQLGNLMPALQAIRRRPYLAGGWPRYQATAHLEEGLLAQQVGDPTGAVAAFTRYLAVRTAAADPRVPVVQATRDSLANHLRGNGPVK